MQKVPSMEESRKEDSMYDNATKGTAKGVEKS